MGRNLRTPFLVKEDNGNFKKNVDNATRDEAAQTISLSRTK